MDDNFITSRKIKKKPLVSKMVKVILEFI